MEVQATCPIHNVELEAKTGQFGNYWSHTIPNVGFCDGKKIKPFKTQIAQPVQTTGIPTEVREPIKQRDYDAEARGKIRSLFLEAKISRDGLKRIKVTLRNLSLH